MTTHSIQFRDKYKKISLNTRICFLDLSEEFRRDEKKK